MSRLWMRVIKNHRIVKQVEEPCSFGEAFDALTEMCVKNDIPRPMWLAKHDAEYNDFRRTAFTKDHFVEEISFDRLEIEFLDDGESDRRSRDPRNDFSDMSM